MTGIDPDLRRRLTVRRIALGLTQYDVAYRMGNTQSCVSGLEGDQQDARLSTLQRWASALGKQLLVSIEDGAGTSISATDRRRDITALFLHAHTCPTGCSEDQEDPGVTDTDYEAADRLLAVLDQLGQWVVVGP